MTLMQMEELLYAIVTGILAWIMICEQGLKLLEFYVINSRIALTALCATSFNVW